MSMMEWAKREVEIASKRERGDKPESEWDYGCACYDSALKAFESLCGDGHSGFSIGITKGILNRLIEGKPLTPIEDTEDVWNVCSRGENGGVATYQCKRMSKVRIKTEDGIDQWIKVRLCFGCDLAISEKEQDKGDYFVLMVIGVDADHNVYVLDYVKERLTFNTQLNTIIDYGRNKFPMVERIGVETVAYQKSLAQELRRLSLLPIININTSKDKVTRAMRRSANFENHKVYFREGMDDLEECLLLFPEVDHDDLFDALDFAMTMADGGNEIRVLKREDFRI